jgi:hypothetical protein
MSAARLLDWLWAAVWLRWRLARVKATRLFRGRPDLVGGPDYHLAPAETPVEGLDYDAAELPEAMVAKLEATQAELSNRVSEDSTTSRHRIGGRRVGSLATAVLLTVGAVGAGAAVVTGSTGVPAVDRLLGIYETELEPPEPPTGPEASGRDLQPRATGPMVSIDLASLRVASTSYVARDGRVCSALADGNANPAAGDLACVSPQSLATYLAQDEGLVLAVNADGDRAVVRGFVSGSVTSLQGRGPNGSLDVHLGDEWLPDVAGLGSLRPFLALGDVEGSGDPGAPNRSDPLRASSPESYGFDAVLENGERIRIGR